MQPAEGLAVLGLREGATVGQVKHAYRQLAQRLHPDKHGGDENSRQQFMRVAQGYRSVMRSLRAAELGEKVGTCRDCLSFGEVIRSMDGGLRCSRCALGGKRFLPLPVITIVTCSFAIAMLVAAAYLLIVAMATGTVLPAAVALVLGLCSLVYLACVAVRVRYCVDPRQRHELERAAEIGRRQARP
jgi:hypothetical protein